jgi:hypothetical protein
MVGAGLVAAALVLAAETHAQSPDPNSYCGRVTDANLLMCEDFEARTLHDDVNVGGSGPLWGPWYDATGFTGARGFNSYWTRTYGSSVSGCAWTQGSPSSPIKGSTCSHGTCFPAEWRADNLWQGNHTACIDIVRNGEFDDEVAGLASPVKPGGTGVFAGLQSMAHRIGAGRMAGILGTRPFGRRVRTFGVTMAVAYAANSQSAGIWNSPWKHNEWGEAEKDGIFLFHNEATLTDQDPFQQFAFMDQSISNRAALCASAVANATIRRGDLSCAHDVALYFRADPTVYRRSRDWPLGTWGCVRGHFENWGTTNTSVKIWFNDVLVIDFSGLNGSFLHARNGYDALVMNAYSNANQPGGLPTTATTYRYEDNIHITAGPPVSCAAIGFGSGGTGTPPSNPTGLRIVG